jgi:hypothetical protein
MIGSGSLNAECGAIRFSGVFALTPHGATYVSFESGRSGLIAAVVAVVAVAGVAAASATNGTDGPHADAATETALPAGGCR